MSDIQTTTRLVATKRVIEVTVDPLINRTVEIGGHVFDLSNLIWLFHSVTIRIQQP